MSTPRQRVRPHLRSGAPSTHPEAGSAVLVLGLVVIVVTRGRLGLRASALLAPPTRTSPGERPLTPRSTDPPLEPEGTSTFTPRSISSTTSAGLFPLPLYAILLAVGTSSPQPDQATYADGWARFVASPSYLASPPHGGGRRAEGAGPSHLLPGMTAIPRRPSDHVRQPAAAESDPTRTADSVSWPRRHRLGTFLGLAFLLSWLPWPLVLLNPDSSPMVPLGPLVAAVLTALLTGG